MLKFLIDINVFSIYSADFFYVDEFSLIIPYTFRLLYCVYWPETDK